MWGGKIKEWALGKTWKYSHDLKQGSKSQTWMNVMTSAVVVFLFLDCGLQELL